MVHTLIGQIFEVRPDQYKDKKTGEVTKAFCVVTIEQTVIDDLGFRRKDTEDVIFEMADFENLSKSIDKYIALPFNYVSFKKNGAESSFMGKTDYLPYTIFDRNPIPQPKKTEPQKP